MKREEELIRRVREQREMFDKITRSGEMLRRVKEQTQLSDRVGEQIRRFEEQSRIADRIGKQLESIRAPHSLTAASESLTKQFATINEGLTRGFKFPTATESLSQFVRQISEAGKRDTSVFTATAAVGEALKKISQQHRHLSEGLISTLTKSPAQDAFKSLTESFATQLETIRASESSFAPSFAESLQSAFETFAEQDSARLANLEREIGERLDSVERSVVEPGWSKQLQRLAALAALAGLMLALLMYLDSKTQSKNQEETARKIVLLLEAIAQHNQNSMTKPYVVVRTVQLKSKPNNKSQTIARLEPNDEVWYIETGSHRWIYVEYTDGSTTTCGWVNKKYLRKLR